MRKLFYSLSKNLKLLFRNKETVYTIIFGPLLIVLLVGFAFMGGDDYKMKIGIAGDHDLRDNTISLLNEKGYLVVNYKTIVDCETSVKEGVSHACIGFSSNTITIFLDESRMNLVYRISDDLSSVMDLQSDSIRQALATDAITRINTAKASISGDIATVDRIKAHQAALLANLTIAKSSLAMIGNSTSNISVKGVSGYQLGIMQDMRSVVELSTTSLEECSKTIHALERDCDSCSNETLDDARALQKTLDDLAHNITLIQMDKAQPKFDQAKYILDVAAADIEDLNLRMINETAARNTLMLTTRSASKEANANSAELEKLDSSLRMTHAVLSGTKANASAIASPVDIEVVSIAAENTKSSFTYPYLFVLIMMFMGLLLASALVVAEKTSRASFRTFTTPTSDAFHIFASFITAFIILIVEAAIILAISMAYISEPLLILTPSTLLIVAISIIIFSFIGMVIGFMVRTQESAMIASISVGSILLFVSNVIAPIEGMAGIVQLLSSINPYLVLSELLKRSMLFGMPINEVFSGLVIVFSMIGALILLMMVIQNRARKKYFKQDGGILAPHIPAPLQIGSKYIRNPVELLDTLDHMTRAEFEQIVKPTDKADENVISIWVKKELRIPGLAKRLRTTSKEKMILQIDDYLKKHGKQMK